VYRDDEDTKMQVKVGIPIPEREVTRRKEQDRGNKKNNFVLQGIKEITIID